MPLRYQELDFISILLLKLALTVVLAATIVLAVACDELVSPRTATLDPQSIDCNDSGLAEEILELSKDNSSRNPLAVRILKLYADAEELERTESSLRCRGTALLDRGGELYVTYRLEIDRDGDAFIGYEIDFTSTPTTSSNPTSVPTATPTPTSSSTLSPTPTPTPTPTPQAFTIGDTVRLDGLLITVNGVRTSLRDGFRAPQEGHYFLYVDVTLRNEGDQPEPVSFMHGMELRDVLGQLYESDAYANLANSSALLGGEISAEIAPGGALQGDVAYQVPMSAGDLTWHFSGFGWGEVTFSLGTVAVPAPPPGLTLDNPVSASEVLLGADGTEIRVLGIVVDARMQVAEENRFNDPPEEGMRFYMVRLEVAYPSAASGSVTAMWSAFSLIGNNRVIYTGEFQSPCGIIPDPLGGLAFYEGQEIYAGGRVEGNVCFAIPQGEGDLILIHQPDHDEGSRRFFSLDNSTIQPDPGTTPTPTPTPAGRWATFSYADNLTGETRTGVRLGAVWTEGGAIFGDPEAAQFVFKCDSNANLYGYIEWPSSLFLFGDPLKGEKLPVEYVLDGGWHTAWWNSERDKAAVIAPEDLPVLLERMGAASVFGIQFAETVWGENTEQARFEVAGIDWAVEQLSCSIPPLTLALSQAKQSLVRVEVHDAAGSGVVVGSDSGHSLVMTAWHVIESYCLELGRECVGVSVVYQGERLHGRLLEFYPLVDLAVLEVERELPVVAIAADVPSIETDVVTIGLPGGEHDFQYNEGRVVRHTGCSFLTCIATNARAWSGFSGGALINLNGELVGIISEGYTGSFYSNAVSTDAIHRLLELAVSS